MPSSVPCSRAVAMHMNMELLRYENVKVVRNAKAGWTKVLTIVNHYCRWRIARKLGTRVPSNHPLQLLFLSFIYISRSNVTFSVST